MLWLILATVLGYTESISLLDYSVIVIPVSKADMAIDLEDKDYQPMNKTDEENMKACKWPISNNPLLLT